MPDRLPIYRVVPQDTSTQRLVALGEQIFGLKEDFKLGETQDAKSLRNGKHVVELGNASGAVWAADESQLWKPSVKGTLPTKSQALSSARAFLKQNKLLPELRDPFTLGKPLVGNTQYALSKGGKRVNRPLDVHVTFPVLVGSIPVTGGGGNLKVTIGPKGNVIGFNGGWRTVTEAFEAKAIPPSAAKAQLKELTGGMKVVNATVSLAYYAAPSFAGQEFLYPVYVCGGTGVFGKQRVPLRQILLAATDFGPPIRFPEPQPKRAKLARPGSTMKEDGKPDPSRIRRSLATTNATRPWEAGTSWIGQSGGLAGSHDNAKGFVDEWAAAGWHVDFNWGDANAWESDWRRNDDTWVDNADFVFYTGHASMNGWVLSNPDDGWLDFSEVGAAPATPGDLWGQSDLEWVVVTRSSDTARSRTTTRKKAASSRSTARAAARSSTRGSAAHARSSRRRTALPRPTGRRCGSGRCGSASPASIPSTTTRGTTAPSRPTRPRRPGSRRCGRRVSRMSSAARPAGRGSRRHGCRRRRARSAPSRRAARRRRRSGPG